MKHNTATGFRFAGTSLAAACVWWGSGCASSPRAVPIGPAATAPAASRSAVAPQSPAASRPAPASAPTTTASQSTRDALEQIIVPSITFENAPIDAVIEELIRISREADPDGAGINMILMPDRPRQPSTQTPQSLGPAAPPPRISMTLRRVALYDLLRITCELADLEMRTHEDLIRLYPRGAAPQAMETRVYPVSPALIPSTIVRSP